jgi:c-di-GMP phosphodiesterase
MSTKVRLARQPIVTANGSTYAYELLFRDFNQLPGQTAEDIIEDNKFATSRVIVNTLNQFGIKNIVGDHIAFLNTDATFLFDDTILTIPAQKFMIEVLEHVIITPELIERIIFLKTKGYRFALDDATFDEAFLKNFDALLEYLDVLKIDISLTTPEEFKQALPKLNQYSFKLLAEKVETKEDFEIYRDLGCDYFQGYFFARPEIKEQATLDPTAQSVLKLINLLTQETPQQLLIDEFELAPSISLQLLRYLNSADLELSTSIKSIQHAIALLGKQPLKSWLLLISFSTSSDISKSSPLFELARFRSIMMTKLASLQCQDKAFISQASFIGLLSLVDNIFHVPLEMIIDELNLDDEVRLALLEHKGIYGQCLQLVINIETMDDTNCKEIVNTLGITQETIQELIVETYTKLSL